MHHRALMSSCSKLMVVPVPVARAITRMGVCCALALSALAMAGCGESDAARAERLNLMDEADEVGFAQGIAERCGLDYQWSRSVPSRYDDSLDEGEIASAWQSGYFRARDLDQACIYGIEGR
jgi:hypothetical protein